MKIVVMSRHVLEVYIRKVVELDALMLSTLGRDYSETGWTEENFRYDLPFKWELSRLAVNGERMAGFWIASASVPGNCHTHRVAVHPAYQGQGDRAGDVRGSRAGCAGPRTGCGDNDS
jgi:ribosomal protein S18 acetylase RimI-like enzyme